jgi:hypothetical protein
MTESAIIIPDGGTPGTEVVSAIPVENVVIPFAFGTLVMPRL